MPHKKESSKKDGKKGQTTLITVSVSAEDLQRLQKAFAEGRLKEFGVIDMTISPTPETETPRKRWGEAEHRKRHQAGDKEELPPL